MSGDSSARPAGLLRGALPAALLLVSACQDRPVLGTRPYEAQPSIHGLVTDGFSSPLDGGGVTVGAVAGLKRTVSSDSLGRYDARVTELTPPYLAQGVTANTFMYAVGMDSGLVNVTPLTSLVAAQLIGQDLYNYFYALPRAGNTALDAITPERVVIAQREVTRMLREMGVTIVTGTADFATTPFSPTAGDPMFDQIAALNSELALEGITLSDLFLRVAKAAMLCNIESLNLTLNGEERLLCPATRSALEDPADPAATVYGFITLAGDSLLVRDASGAVTAVRYVLATGETLDCTGACGVSIGAFRPDSTVPIGFAGTTLGGGGAATLTGTVTSAPGGVVLPPLFCVENKFVLIKPDRAADASCLFNPGSSSPTGAWTSYGFSDEFTRYSLGFTAEGTDIRYFTFAHFDENYQLFLDYACELSGCNGVTIGPEYPDGFGQTLRKVTFDRTRLSTVSPDGSVGPPFATLTMSAVVTVTPPAFPPGPDCTGLDSVRITYSDGTPALAICPADASSLGSFLQADGEPGYYFTDSNFDNLQIEMEGSAIRRVYFGSFNTNGQGGTCLAGGCAGVTVSDPDGEGMRTITFANTLVTEVDPNLQLSALRTMTLNGVVHGFPPPPAPSVRGPAGGPCARCRPATVSPSLPD